MLRNRTSAGLMSCRLDDLCPYPNSIPARKDRHIQDHWSRPCGRPAPPLAGMPGPVFPHRAPARAGACAIAELVALRRHRMTDLSAALRAGATQLGRVA
jgi:hypothetical protein